MRRIAILVCDTPAPPVAAAGGGDYAALFERLLRAAAPTAAFAVAAGSKHGANDGGWVDALVAYVSALDLARTRVVGVCFGHQIVAKAFGARVSSGIRGAGKRAGSEWCLTEAGKQFFQCADKDSAVVDCPPGFSVLMATDLCPIQALLKEDQILTIQSHPEFTEPMVREIVKLRRDNGVFDANFSEEVISLLDKNHGVDNFWFSKQIVRFLGLD
ncbi:glutamine amidotransferase class-I [Obelidium mucronatum]|nr:glutamine amidotransferase class-I [Obelidium mucronatum]